jgi:anti-anti-sigma factor
MGDTMEIIEHQEGKIRIIAVIGRMDALTSPALDERLSDCISHGENRLRIDLAGVDYISSAGIRTVLVIAKGMEAQQGEVVFCRLSRPVENAFRDTGLMSILRIEREEMPIIKASPLSNREYADCFNVYKQISTEWTAIREWVNETFIPFLGDRQSLDILSVGSGTGDFDLTLMTLLSPTVPVISYVALDPNQEHNRLFQERFEKDQPGKVSLRIIPSVFREDVVAGTYDLIQMTHCLYYVEDRKKAIQLALSRLNPGGSLLIFHQTPMGVNEIQRTFMRQVKGDDEEELSSQDIVSILHELGIVFSFDMIISDLDVTDCIVGNHRGRLLLNFFLESNLDEVDAFMRRKIVATMKEISQEREGRYYMFHPGGIFWIKKDGDATRRSERR